MKVLLSSLVAVSAMSAMLALATDQSMNERLAPVGKVCMAGDACAAAVQVASSGEPRSGEEIYKSHCVTCHSGAVPAAPKFGDKDSWAPHIAKGMDVLYHSAMNGTAKGMPPKGLCMDCSEDELKGAVDYMVNNSK